MYGRKEMVLMKIMCEKKEENFLCLDFDDPAKIKFSIKVGLDGHNTH